jgi:methionyl-tRNA synthetase
MQTNKYLTEVRPWTYAEEGNTAAVHQSVYYGLETLRITGILLQPFIPQKASEVLDRLGVDSSRRTMEYAKLHADDSYGVSFVELGEGAHSSVFPPLPVED